ncbi:zinc finger protein 420-like [Lingula anatina]|uniref:Zinc finger protein 420-like n=1 Tax=Lingula anatina TaxID=7574 RepID=A0A1S3H8T9_LINAN|nr:zinc finger protein 420-like [Lingula anatina]|eukprot:XP_013382417.1 zinc finger protein 420-like [Lingula anatina]
MVAEVRTAAVARDRIEKTPAFATLPASRKKAVPKGKPTTSPRVMTQSTPYECKTCGISNFANVQEYYHHFGEKHGGLGCRHCSVKFNSLDELGYHLFLAHKEKLFMCNKCGFGALSTTALRQHMLDLHEKVRCNLCGRCYEGKAYRIHLMGHTKKCHVRIERLSRRVLKKYGISGLSKEIDVGNAVVKDNGSIPRNDVALEDDVVVVE